MTKEEIREKIFEIVFGIDSWSISNCPLWMNEFVERIEVYISFIKKGERLKRQLKTKWKTNLVNYQSLI